MNRITISGNLTREPESQAVNEWSIIKFAIANNDERRKNDKGEYEGITSFFDCEYWTKNPAYWLNQLRKGTPVVIEGRLKQEKWEKDGQTRYAVRIVVQGVPIGAASKADKVQVVEPATQKPADIGGPEQFDDDQIPF